MSRKVIYACPGKTPRYHTGYPTAPAILDEFDSHASPWYEGPADAAQAFRNARRRDALLAWICAQMQIDFSEQRRYAIEQHYFANLTFREIAGPIGVAASTVKRRADAGISELRSRAVASGLRRDA